MWNLQCIVSDAAWTIGENMFEVNKKLLSLGRGSTQPTNGKKNGKDVISDDSGEIALWQKENEGRISKFLLKVKENYNGVILPDVHYAEGRYLYLALKDADGVVTETDFMDKLASTDPPLLEKFVHNQFLVCPQHKSSFLVNVRMFCPKCNSICVQRLHLLEHKSCGYLAEKIKFVESQNGDIKCPSCGKVIKNPQKEVRVPATWYYCNDCEEKFDDATIRLYCKEYDHDFSISEAKPVTIYGYAIASSERPQFDYLKLKGDVVKMLSEFELVVEENYLVKGKSGNDHVIDVCGTNKKGQSVFILINNSSESNSVDSRIIQVLDTMPNTAILAGYPTVTEKIKSVASKYNASVIASQNVQEILSEIKKILSQRMNLGVAAAR